MAQSAADVCIVCTNPFSCRQERPAASAKHAFRAGGRESSVLAREDLAADLDDFPGTKHSLPRSSRSPLRRR